MPIGNYYNAPGAAASDSIEQLLADRAQLARQGAQDRLQFMEFAQRQQAANAALKEKQQEHQDQLDEKDKQTTLKIVAALQPGDIPDAYTIAKAEKYHIPLPMTVSQPTTTGLTGDQAVPESMLGLAAVPLGPKAPPNVMAEPPVQQGLAPTREGVVPRPEAGPVGGGFRFAGSPQQQSERELLQGLDPKSLDYKALQYQITTGKPIPAGLIKPPIEPETVLVVSPDRTKFQQLLPDGTLKPFTGTVPKGARIIEQPQPKDTSASEAVNADRDARRLDTAQEHAVTEFKDLTKSLEDSMIKYDRVETMLNQKTAQADADVAPLILGATVGGTGSGFRMTRAEIDNTLKGRTKWEDLEATLNKWSADPQHFTIPDSQREAMKTLARAIRAHGAGLHKKIIDMRYKIADMTDPKEILKARVKLHDEMFPETGPSAAPTAADLIKKALGQ